MTNRVTFEQPVEPRRMSFKENILMMLNQGTPDSLQPAEEQKQVLSKSKYNSAKVQEIQQ